MARRSGPGLQAELLRLLQPPVTRRAALLSERVAPVLAEIGDRLIGRPADEVLAALDAAIRDAGGVPDRAALQDLARQVAAGANPFT